MTEGVLMKYREFLPVTNSTPMVTLGEGSTPLVKSNNLGYEFGCKELYFKLEGCNPTGSFKDRGMVVAVAKAVESGSKSVLCASTGNTSASAAAYGAYCGIPATVFVPKGDVAKGKMAQAMAYGANILVVDGTFDQALSLARTISSKHHFPLVNSVNPHRIDGQKTAAFELVDELGNAPDYVFIPVGNAGNITAYWKGFKEYKEKGFSTGLPKMMGFEAVGAAPIVDGHPIASPTTVASAIRIGNPASWDHALVARDESGGIIDTVTDDEILEAYRLLSSREGIFCEPASAASLAGVINRSRQGLDLSHSRVVCIITGTGLKDSEVALGYVHEDLLEVPAELGAVEEALMTYTANMRG